MRGGRGAVRVRASQDQGGEVAGGGARRGKGVAAEGQPGEFFFFKFQGRGREQRRRETSQLNTQSSLSLSSLSLSPLSFRLLALP